MTTLATMSTEHDEASSPRRRTVLEFWSGLTETTAFSWLAILTFALLEFWVLTLYLTPRRLAKIDYTYYAETRSDDYAELTEKVLRLKTSSTKDELGIVYVGASSSRRSLQDRNDEKLGEILSAKAGRRVRFHLLATNNERYEDALLIADQMPKDFRGVFVFGVNAQRADYRDAKKLSALRARLPFHSHSLDALIKERKEPPLRHTGSFFLDHLDFFAARRVAALRFDEAPSKYHRGKKGTKAQKVEEARRVIARFKSLKETRKPGILGASKKTYLRLATAMRKKKVPLVVLENPTNPLRDEIAPEIMDAYRRDIADLAGRQETRYLNFNEEMHFVPQDFQDHMHLGSASARKRYQARLMTALAEVLDESYPTEKERAADETSGESRSP